MPETKLPAVRVDELRLGGLAESIDRLLRRAAKGCRHDMPVELAPEHGGIAEELHRGGRQRRWATGRLPDKAVEGAAVSVPPCDGPTSAITQAPPDASSAGHAKFGFLRQRVPQVSFTTSIDPSVITSIDPPTGSAVVRYAASVYGAHAPQRHRWGRELGRHLLRRAVGSLALRRGGRMVRWRTVPGPRPRGRGVTRRAGAKRRSRAARGLTPRWGRSPQVLEAEQVGQEDRLVAVRAGTTQAEGPAEEPAVGAAAFADQALTAAWALVDGVGDQRPALLELPTQHPEIGGLGVMAEAVGALLARPGAVVGAA